MIQNRPQKGLSSPAKKSVSRSQDNINAALLEDLGMRAPATQKFLLILILSGAAGGAGAAGAAGTPVFYLHVAGEVFLADQGIKQLAEAEREQALMMMSTSELKASGTIDPSKVHFLQDNARLKFQDKTLPNVDQPFRTNGYHSATRGEWDVFDSPRERAIGLQN